MKGGRQRRMPLDLGVEVNKLDFASTPCPGPGVDPGQEGSGNGCKWNLGCKFKVGVEEFGEMDHPFHAHALTSGHRSPAGSLAAQWTVSTPLREVPDLRCDPEGHTTFPGSKVRMRRCLQGHSLPPTAGLESLPHAPRWHHTASLPAW